jgi:RNA 3'-phosphate cyclase
VAEYFGGVFAYFLGRMGVQVRVLEVRPGFYPKGGGSLRISVRPEHLRPLSLTSRGEAEGISADSIATSDLRKARVAERQLEGVAEVLEVDPARAEYVHSASTGTAVHVRAGYANCRLGASALGKRGKPAERVGREAAESLRRAMATGACLDEHMADQILPYLALAGGPSEVTVARITDHCRTNMWVIEKFLPVSLEPDEEAGLIRCRC